VSSTVSNHLSLERKPGRDGAGPWLHMEHNLLL